jgi:SAM-dependent methyltransferase
MASVRARDGRRVRTSPRAVLTLDFDRLDLRPGATLLDLGCGNGRHSFAAARRGAHVVSVDLNAESLSYVTAIAAAMADQGEIAPTNLFAALRGDGTALPFADGAFDAIVVAEVLEHVWNDYDALSEVRRVLKPGGTLAVTVPRYWPERVCWALSTEYHTKPGGHVRIYRLDELTDKLRAAGFEVRGSHYAHALHAPYWWLRCMVGPDNETSPPVRAYRAFLEWDITAGPRPVRALERALDPVLGKSLVVYATSPEVLVDA